MKNSDEYGLPATGFLRLSQIIGDRHANPPIPGIFPVSKSTWWLGVKNGKFPRPIHLSTRVTAWKVEDVLRLISEQHD
jgi:prophage regulatory protein